MATVKDSIIHQKRDVTDNAFTALEVGGNLSYSDSAAVTAVTASGNFFQGVLVQNKDDSSSSSANVVCVNDSAGTDYVAMGINSSTFSNLYNTLFEIPNASYMSGTADTVIGSQSDHSSDKSLYLTYNSGAGAVCIDSSGAISYNASRPAGVLNKGDFGTAGQVLQSAGTSAPPVWTDGNTFSNDVIVTKVDNSPITLENIGKSAESAT